MGLKVLNAHINLQVQDALLRACNQYPALTKNLTHDIAKISFLCFYHVKIPVILHQYSLAGDTVSVNLNQQAAQSHMDTLTSHMTNKIAM